QALTVVVHHDVASRTAEGDETAHDEVGREVIEDVDRHERTETVSDHDDVPIYGERIEHPAQDARPESLLGDVAMSLPEVLQDERLQHPRDLKSHALWPLLPEEALERCLPPLILPPLSSGLIPQ